MKMTTFIDIITNECIKNVTSHFPFALRTFVITKVSKTMIFLLFIGKENDI
jgi:hypothetical protein